MRLHQPAALGPTAAPRWRRTGGPLATIVRRAHSIVGEDGRNVSELRLALDVLTPAERRDLANALLRAAWSAVLEETRILLVDLLLEADETILEEAA